MEDHSLNLTYLKLLHKNDSNDRTYSFSQIINHSLANLFLENANLKQFSLTLDNKALATFVTQTKPILIWNTKSIVIFRTDNQIFSFNNINQTLRCKKVTDDVSFLSDLSGKLIKKTSDKLPNSSYVVPSDANIIHKLKEGNYFFSENYIHFRGQRCNSTIKVGKIGRIKDIYLENNLLHLIIGEALYCLQIRKASLAPLSIVGPGSFILKAEGLLLKLKALILVLTKRGSLFSELDVINKFFALTKVVLYVENVKSLFNSTTGPLFIVSALKSKMLYLVVAFLVFNEECDTLKSIITNSCGFAGANSKTLQFHLKSFFADFFDSASREDMKKFIDLLNSAFL